MKQRYNRYFPTPSYLSMSSFSLDISDQSIKYGELIATPQGLQLGSFGKEKIPYGIVVSGKIEDEEKLVLILKNIKNREHFNFVRVALPEEQMYIFTMSLPKVNKNNLKEIIFFQIEDHIPLQAEEVIFDYDIISENNQNIFIEVSAVAKDTIESYLSVLRKSELVPLSFELEAQAIARAVIPYNDPRPIMIIDFGDTRTGVTIVNKGRVFLATTLSIGGLNLTNMIAKNFSLSLDEAEKMKYLYGIDNTQKTKDIFPTIINSLSVLRDEINKQYLYWETHQEGEIKHEKINRIILCGGDANLAGFSEYLQLSIGVKVEHANVWVNILDIQKTVPTMSFKESLSYTTVLGLSLADHIDKTQSVINVLPKNEKSVIKKIYWVRFFTAFLNIVSLMSILAVILLFPSFFFSKTKEKLAENRLVDFNSQNNTNQIQDFDTIVKDINLKLNILEETKPIYQINNKILEELLAARFDGIIFNQIIFSKKGSEGGILEIRGQALDRIALRNFKLALDNNSSYSEINLPISNFIERSNLNFIISIKVK